MRQLKRLANMVLSSATMRRCLNSVPPIQRRLPASHRTHPFDRQYGTDTSGVVPVHKILSNQQLRSQIIPYAASQPGIIRPALLALGIVDEYGFTDLGCGKGRALVVAGEFPFRSITGIELSPQLAGIARRNLAIVEHRFPGRPAFTVIEGNAVNAPFPEGKLALFLYHPFGPDLLSQLITNLEARLTSGKPHIFLIYYNPVHGNLLDASPAFTRWYAKTLPYDPSELGFGPDTDDTVVIWQSVAGSLPTPHPHADRPIITKSSWRAGLLL
jgi:SAM-dependent methyltransferase